MKFWRRGMAHMAMVAGALSASATGDRSPTSGAIVRLPPYIVTETASRVRWHYAAIPGYEILSCCSVSDTQKFALDIARQQAWLDQMLPPQFQAGHSVPTAFIVLNDSVAKAMTNDIAALTNQTLAQMAQAEKASGPSIYIPQLKLTDNDSVDVDVIFNYRPTSYVELDPNYVLSCSAAGRPRLQPLVLHWHLRTLPGLHRRRRERRQQWHLHPGRIPPAFRPCAVGEPSGQRLPGRSCRRRPLWREWRAGRADSHEVIAGRAAATRAARPRKPPGSPNGGGTRQTRSSS